MLAFSNCNMPNAIHYAKLNKLLNVNFIGLFYSFNLKTFSYMSHT